MASLLKLVPWAVSCTFTWRVALADFSAGIDHQRHRSTGRQTEKKHPSSMMNTREADSLDSEGLLKPDETPVNQGMVSLRVD